MTNPNNNSKKESPVISSKSIDLNTGENSPKKPSQAVPITKLGRGLGRLIPINSPQKDPAHSGVSIVVPTVVVAQPGIICRRSHT